MIVTVATPNVTSSPRYSAYFQYDDDEENGGQTFDHDISAVLMFRSMTKEFGFVIIDHKLVDISS